MSRVGAATVVDYRALADVAIDATRGWRQWGVMDAGKYITATGSTKHKMTDVQARRIAMANALRDLADEIETGTRAVSEMQTFEMIANNKHPTSILHLISQLTTLPSGAKP